MPAWINEFHYDNAGADTGEFIEIAATAGTDLTGWKVVLYNGNGGATYGTLTTLSGVVTDQGAGFGTVVINYPTNGLQNGPGGGADTFGDGFALVDSSGHVVQFLSYEGVITATNGPAAGMSSTDVGVFEDGTKLGTSLGLAGTGTDPSQLHWVLETTTSAGGLNPGETLSGGSPPPPPPPVPSISVSNASVTEGDNGTTTETFTVTRTGGTGAFNIDFATHDGTATADSDYQAASGTLSFAAGQTSQTVSVVVNGDTTVEPDETFTLNLSNPTGGATIAQGTGTGTIVNDDVAPVVTGTPFINEFHYDNAGTDTGEFIEVAGPAGLNLSGYSLVLYNGHDGTTYGSTINLSGTIGDQQNGFGVVSIALPVNGLQNGGSGTTPEADGIALIGPGGHVVEFISYEGHFVAANGPAAGMTSTDVGVAEDGTANGTSIARTGPGVDASDFTWTLGQNSHGTVNPGETFLSPSPRLHVSDATVTEGDTGTTTLSFTVTRTGTDTAFTVDYSTHDGTATAGSDYLAAAGTLSFAVGETSKIVTVTVNGDTALEGDETLTLNLANPTAGAQIVDGQGLGVIKNDDVALVHTYEIQGAGHTSPLVGQHVFTSGVVTAIDTTGSKGFWIQDPTGDGDDRTSDAVFVFTGVAPTVNIGDLVKVEGTVNEFQGNDTNNLTITEVGSSNASVEVLGHGFTIAPTLIGGADGRHIPTEVIDSDHFGTFNPDHDAVDFYESIEGMLVTFQGAQAVNGTFTGETFIVAADDATGLNSRGGITIAPGDMNPEAIELFQDTGVTGGGPALPTLSYVSGDHLGDVTGVVSYFGGNYELIPISVGSTASAGTAVRETTGLHGDASHLTIGEFNLDNIDPTDPQSKFDQLAADIVGNLGAPNIIGLEEIQDADGAANTVTDFSGAATLNKLIAAIDAAGGPHYSFIEIAPTANNQTGGEPNGNIHQAFLYDASKVSYVDGSVRQLSDDDPTNGDAYNNSRKPLVADFQFHGETVTVIDVHDYSRGGSDELMGLDQPAAISGDQRRTDQTAPIERYVQQLEAANPYAHVVVTGDFNGFQFETAQTQLETGGILTNLTNLLDPTDRYSFIFEGNMEQLDHMYASPSLMSGVQFDIVHLNTGQTDRPTDHDPTLGLFAINTAPVSAADSYAATEDTALSVDAQHGVLANDTDANHDVLTAVLQQGPAHGTLTLNAEGSFSYQAAANYNGADTFSYVTQDAYGGVSGVQTVTLNVAAVNDAPVATADVSAVVNDHSVSIDVLANDTDVDTGDTKSIVSVGETALGGHVSIVDGQLVYAADADAFDLLAAGQQVTDSFSYVMTDSGGAQSTATVNVTVTGIGTAPTLNGGNGDSTLTGTDGSEAINGGNGADRLIGGGGADTLSSGNGTDTLLGGAGIDSLAGGNGADVLDGGAGNDTLTGGNGPDRFVFTGGFGKDVVTDFDHTDKIQLDHAAFADFNAVLAHAQQVGADVVISLDTTDTITLQNTQLGGLSAGEFLFA